MSSRTFSATPSVLVEVAVAVERQQRPRPGDRLPHAGQLVELLLAQPGDRRAHAVGDRLRHAGQAGADDLRLALARRVVDPVVQAAALERVVQLARAVRREHDQRALPCRDRAELGDRDREVGEELEQERLELVVGAVDLVDQQHRRTVVLERLQQRPPDQELAPRTARAPRRPPRRRGSPAAGAGSPSRRRRGGGRSPRGTAAGSAARPATWRARGRPRSCPRRPRPRAAAAARGSQPGRRRC